MSTCLFCTLVHCTIDLLDSTALYHLLNLEIHLLKSPCCLLITVLIWIFTCCEGSCIHQASREHSTSTEPSLGDSKTVVYVVHQIHQMYTPDDQYPPCPHQHKAHMSPCSRCAWYCCMWQVATHIKYTEVGDSATAERFHKPIMDTSDQATSYSLLVAEDVRT